MTPDEREELFRSVMIHLKHSTDERASNVKFPFNHSTDDRNMIYIACSVKADMAKRGFSPMYGDYVTPVGDGAGLQHYFHFVGTDEQMPCPQTFDVRDPLSEVVAILKSCADMWEMIDD